MYCINEFCCICFKSSTQLSKIRKKTIDIVLFLKKLIVSVAEEEFPELNESFLLCEECQKFIGSTYRFRKACLTNKWLMMKNILKLRSVGKDSRNLNVCLVDMKNSKMVELPSCDNWKESKENVGSKDIVHDEISFDPDFIQTKPNDNNDMLFECKKEVISDDSIENDFELNDACIKSEMDVKVASEHKEMLIIESANGVIENMEIDEIEQDKEYKKCELIYDNACCKEEIDIDDKSCIRLIEDAHLENGVEEEKGESVDIIIQTDKLEEETFIEITVDNAIEVENNSKQSEEAIEETSEAVQKNNEIDEPYVQYNTRNRGTRKSFYNWGDSDEDVDTDTTYMPSECSNTGNKHREKEFEEFEEILGSQNEEINKDINSESDIDVDGDLEDSTSKNNDNSERKSESLESGTAKNNDILEQKSESLEDGTSESNGKLEVKSKSDLLQQKKLEADKQTENLLLHNISPKKFKCKTCNKIFEGRKTLMIHKKSHTDRKLFTCDVCNISLKSLLRLEMHKKISCFGRKPITIKAEHTKLKDLRCDICNKTFTSKFIQKQHQRVHTGEKPYKCDECGKTFSYQSGLFAHRRIHLGEKAFKCEVCDKAFMSRIGLKEHGRIHSGDKPYKCDICGRGFYTGKYLDKHYGIHTKEKAFPCEHCDKSYILAHHLKVHLRTHTGEKPFKCDVCGKSFTESCILKRHYEYLHSDKTYPCKFCGKKLKKESALRVHERFHTGEKPYKCKVCNEAYISASYLRKHMLKHTTKDSYPCDTCKKVFFSSKYFKNHTCVNLTCEICKKTLSTAANLKTHLVIHQGLKPYKCDDCGKSYTQPSNLKLHLNKCKGKKSNQTENEGEDSD